MKQVCVFIVMVCSWAPSFAKIKMPEIVDVPVRRLIQNLERDLKSGENWPTRLSLARLYTMMYVKKLNPESLVPAEVEKQNPKYLDHAVPRLADVSMLFTEWNVKGTASQAEAQQYLKKAIANYEKVTRKHQNEFASLGLAWCYLEAGQKEKAKALLRKLVPRDPTNKDTPFNENQKEAANYLIPLLDPQKDRAEIEGLEVFSKRQDSMERLVSPLVFSVKNEPKSLDSMRAGFVQFDLDGRGPRSWRWLTADAGWLVHSVKDGRVTSGLQMFGNVSWWVFWRNGFEALSALDDDGNGWVEGRELDGIQVWQDRNSNGVSDPGEIRPLSKFGITGLATSYKVGPTGEPENECGVRLQKGSCRPLYDFISEAKEERTR